MLSEETMAELMTLRITTLGACKRLRARARRVLLHHCLCTIDNVLESALGISDYRLYRSLWECRKAIGDALNSKPRSRLAFTRSLRDQAVEVCREAGLWKPRE